MWTLAIPSLECSMSVLGANTTRNEEVVREKEKSGKEDESGKKCFS